MAKFILITGVTQGLGRVLLEEFARGGHTVAGCGRSADLITELSKKYPAPHALRRWMFRKMRL